MIQWDPENAFVPMSSHGIYIKQIASYAGDQKLYFTQCEM